MKYAVRVGDEDVEVTLDADGVRVGDSVLRARLEAVEGTPAWLLRIGDTVHRIIARRGAGRGRFVLWTGGHRYDVEALDERTRAIRELSAAAAGPVGPAPVVAPMPGLVVRVSVQPGDRVQAGQGVVVMEAMKMENELRAAGAGVVKAVLVATGTPVEKGAVLVELE
ncbi:MAG TPA: biotin/lipoyl-containing protein [Gemmatimonadaceae bacterium]|nr:biotin/lipoyl-containing protein [Gemmatimonadaceae bacterium]